MTDLAMVVPSRGRPHNIQGLLETARFVTTTRTLFVIVVDDDDPALPGYQEIDYGQHTTFLVLSEPRKIGPILNAVVVPLAREYPFVGFMGDDHRPRTKGWDETLMEAIKWPAGVAYGNDLLQGANLPTAVVMSSWLVNRLGYFCPPGVEHLFLDNFWKLLGQETRNLAYKQGVIIEHCHPAAAAHAGKVPWDAGYAFSMSAEAMLADRARYQEFLAGRWQEDRKLVARG